jgi:hypothetical protein
VLIWRRQLVAASIVSGVTVEVDGLLWRPAAGATVTAEEFIAARSLIREVHRLQTWSPWVCEDRAELGNIPDTELWQWIATRDDTSLLHREDSISLGRCQDALPCVQRSHLLERCS